MMIALTASAQYTMYYEGNGDWLSPGGTTYTTSYYSWSTPYYYSYTPVSYWHYTPVSSWYYYDGYNSFDPWWQSNYYYGGYHTYFWAF